MAWLTRRLTPHPVATYETRLIFEAPLGNGVRCTYVACAKPEYVPLAGSRAMARQRTDWRYRTIEAGHDCMVTAPEALAAMLKEERAAAG